MSDLEWAGTHMTRLERFAVIVLSWLSRREIQRIRVFLQEWDEHWDDYRHA